MHYAPEKVADLLTRHTDDISVFLLLFLVMILASLCV